ncbi:recombinase family protein [Nonomuraea sp. B19D2]|uniref:recombinase family protein n=1 Tax=Nonomuraea sp. B19D2 TaxID=3159561 RepID=UPI0032DBE6FD
MSSAASRDHSGDGVRFVPWRHSQDYARTIKTAVPHQRVILTVHEMKRLGRGAAELLTIAEQLRHRDIELDLLTGPLQGLYDPSGHGAALFAFFAGMAESEREYSVHARPCRNVRNFRPHSASSNWW